MPLRFGTSGSVRASSTPKSARCAHVVHTFWPVTTHSSPSRSARRRERREVGARARLAEQLAPLLLVAHDRRQEAQPLLLGAVREQRRRGEVEPERVEPAEVVRRAARPRRARAVAGARSRPPYATGQVGTTSPDAANTGYQASYSARVRTSRIAAAPPRAAGVDPRARHVLVDPRAHGRDDRVRRRVARRPRACVGGRSSTVELRRTLLAERGEPLAEVLAARRQLERERLVARAAARASAPRPACSSHFVSPSATVGPLRERADELVDRAVELGRRAPRGGSRPTSAASAPVELAPEQQQLAGRARRRRGAAAATSRRCRA